MNLDNFETGLWIKFKNKLLPAALSTFPLSQVFYVLLYLCDYQFIFTDMCVKIP